VPKGSGRWGQLDLGGNVLERVLDGATAAPKGKCDDCAILGASAPGGGLRGGGWSGLATNMETAQEVLEHPELRFTTVGARCARDL
jgi:formylglycine-generating enzyme required for sulfatase activity